MRERVDEHVKMFLSKDRHFPCYPNTRSILWWKQVLEQYHYNLGGEWKVAKDIYKVASKVLKSNP